MQYLRRIPTILTIAALTCTSPVIGEESIDRIRQGSFAVSDTQLLNPLRLVDWNIDRGEQLDKIASELEQQKPDICLLQEADLFTRRSGEKNVAEQLAQRLHLDYVFAPEFQELSQGQEGQPSFTGQVILSRLPVRSARIIRFRKQSGFWKPHSFLPNVPLMQRRLGGRMALVAEVDFGGKVIVIYNTHLESRSLGKLQTLQLDEILEDAAHYPAGTPILLGGDLNTMYNTRSIANKLRVSGWQSAFGNRTPRTLPMMVWSLDWILTKPPLSIKDGQVIHHGGSDHYPITALVSL